MGETGHGWNERCVRALVLGPKWASFKPARSAPQPGVRAVHVAVVVGHNPPVVLVGLPVVLIHATLVLAVTPVNLAVVRGHTPLVLLVHAVDLALQLGLSLALRGTHLTVELGRVESSRHQLSSCGRTCVLAWKSGETRLEPSHRALPPLGHGGDDGTLWYSGEPYRLAPAAPIHGPWRCLRLGFLDRSWHSHSRWQRPSLSDSPTPGLRRAPQTVTRPHGIATLSSVTGTSVAALFG